MTDPIRGMTGWISPRGERDLPTVAATWILRRDPYVWSARFIARHELRIWFEPNWHLARRLAARYPTCLVCSIPVESDTASLRRIPGWRRRRDRGWI
jgi:hypothetical protein